MSATQMAPESSPEEQHGEVAKDFFTSESDAARESEAATESEANKESTDPKADLQDDAQSTLKKADGASEGTDLKQHEQHGQSEKKGSDWQEKAAALKNFVKERGIVVSNAIRRLSGKKEDIEQEQVADEGVIANEQALLDLKGRVVLFSKSGCTDSRAARSLLREKKLPFAEVNLDIFPQRSLDLEERTGTASVPQVFFNEQLIGGIDELKELLKSGELDEKIKEVAATECPASAPSVPVYGEDETQAAADEFAEVIQKLREKVQVKDRFHKLRHFTKCFVGSEVAEFLSEDQYCEAEEAIELGRTLAKKHFFHHVLNEHLFEGGANFYRFLEHDPSVFRCLNFSGLTNDCEPPAAQDLSARLRKLLLAIYERYASDDGKYVNYYAIALSEEFRRYVKLSEELHRVDLQSLSREEKLSFFLNIYNAMVIHAIIRYGRPDGPLERRRFFADVQYVIGGYPYSLSAIENGILRANQRPPYELTKSFSAKDPRLQVALKEPEPLVHFALCFGTVSCPALRCCSPEGVDAELRASTKQFLETGVKVETEARTVTMSKMMKWYSADFGKNEREVLHWLVKHVVPTKAEHLLSLLEDSAPIKVNYTPFEWTLNVLV